MPFTITCLDSGRRMSVNFLGRISLEPSSIHSSEVEHPVDLDPSLFLHENARFEIVRSSLASRGLWLILCSPGRGLSHSSLLERGLLFIHRKEGGGEIWIEILPYLNPCVILVGDETRRYQNRSPVFGLTASASPLALYHIQLQLRC